jgi:hypothetical protein
MWRCCICELSHRTSLSGAAQFKTFTLKFLIIKTAFTFGAVVRGLLLHAAPHDSV